MNTDEYTTEFTKVGDSIRLTGIELLRDLRARNHQSAATCVAELIDHVTKELDAAAQLARVYVR